MAPETKDKKRKASESAAPPKPPKKTKKYKNDDASRPAKSSPQTTSKSTSTKPDGSALKTSKDAPPTKPSPAQAPKKAGHREKVIPDSLNAPSSKLKLPRKRAADFMSDSEASDKEDGGVSMPGKTKLPMEKTDQSQKKRQKPKQQKGNDSASTDISKTKVQVDASKIESEETVSETSKAKKNKPKKKQASQLKKDAEPGQSIGQPGETKSAKEPVTATKSILANVADTGKMASKQPKETISGMTSRVVKAISTLSTNGAEDDDGENDGTDSISEEGDQTADLLKGFADDDSSDGDGSSKDGDYEQGDTLPPLDISASRQKKLLALKKKVPDGPGTIYVGHIPHGFYEHEMKAYFGQFGEIQKLRLSRNKKTGASKHYAFIEFASAGVAKVAAQAMDNYLLFTHILKVNFIPPDQIPKDLWKGANRRFNKVPRSKMEKEKLERGRTEQQWESKNEAEQKRREEKLQKLTGIGYVFDMPTLKNPKAPTAAEDPVGPEDTKSFTSSPSPSSESASGSASEDEKVKLPNLKTKAAGAAKETSAPITQGPKTKKGTKGGDKPSGPDTSKANASPAVASGKGALTKRKTVDPAKDQDSSIELKTDEKLKLPKKNKKVKQPAPEAAKAEQKPEPAEHEIPKFEPPLKAPNPVTKAKVKQQSTKGKPKEDKKAKGGAEPKQTNGAATGLGAVAEALVVKTKGDGEGAAIDKSSKKSKKVEQVTNKAAESSKSEREGGAKAEKIKKPKKMKQEDAA